LEILKPPEEPGRNAGLSFFRECEPRSAILGIAVRRLGILEAARYIEKPQ
jgi:hypothetical protein